jgi:hypothetical protein
MSGTINLSGAVRVTNGSFVDAFAPSPVSLTETNSGVTGGSQSIPTTAGGTVITIGSLTAYGYAAFQNLDATNYVSIGVQVAATFYPVLRLMPGEFAICRLEPAITFYARANTASVVLFTRIWEN